MKPTGPLAALAVLTAVQTVPPPIPLLAPGLGVPSAHATDAPAETALAPGAVALKPPGGGVVRALVIGIDRYRHVKPLRGAVADAVDLAATLKRTGVEDVTILLDEQAGRQAILDGLAGLATRSGPDDLVVVSFAGHGTQDTARRSAAEPDGLDEFFVLAGFAWDGPGLAERILDDELFAAIGAIAKSGARTLFLADNCHGGGMAKAIDPRAATQSVRAIFRGEAGAADGASREAKATETKNSPAADTPDAMGAIVPSEDATRLYPNLTFLAAVGDQQLAPELVIPGQATYRGALSYVAARAFEGHADADGDGITSRRELMSFTRRHVRMLSANRQLPVGEPRAVEAADMPILRTLGKGGPVSALEPVGPLGPEGTPAKPGTTLVPKPQAPAGADAQGSAASEPPGTGKVAAPIGKPGTATVDDAPQSPASSAVVWDRATGDIIDVFGNVVAYARPEHEVAKAIERLNAFHALNRLAVGRAIDVELTPENRIFARGEQFTALAGGLYGSHLIIVNLAGNGEVQYLFPTGNADPLIDRDTLPLPFNVEPPFGTDTLVFIAARERRPDLELALRLINGKTEPIALASAIAAHLGAGDRIGLATYSTKPR
ncbi:MAG: caspase family protein [Hyphomicrobiaceae bacterium]|nr:caspase family protein [Hyphomicrobiaceae bacterium]